MPTFAPSIAPVAKAAAKAPSALSRRGPSERRATVEAEEREREPRPSGPPGAALDLTRISAHSGSLRVQRKCAACRDDEEKVRRFRAPRVQRRLLIGDDDDVHEREADRIAAEIVARTPDIHADEAARVPGEPLPSMDPGTGADLKSGGARLPDHVRAFFETGLGYDLGQVRVHEGTDAQQRNRDVHAHAFTYGSHIWLGRNQPVATSFVMAHELVHVVQQTQPARTSAGDTDIDDAAPRGERACCGSAGSASAGVAGIANADSPSPAAQRVQRIDIFDPYWDPGDHDGTRNHRYVLPDIGKANSIFTEAPVPNASKAGALLGTNLSGEADFYEGTSVGTPRTVGVAYAGSGQPVELKSNQDTKFAGAKFAHKTESAPRPGGTSGPAVVRIDEAPTVIRVADLKPAYGSIEAKEGTGQLDNYIKGFRIAEHETNDLANAGKGAPKGSRWRIATIEKLKKLTIPPQFKEPHATGQASKKLVLKHTGGTKVVPKQDVMGKIFVKEDPGNEGIFNYVWRPDNPRTGAGGLPGTLTNLKRNIQQEIIVPATTLPKAKRIKGVQYNVRNDRSRALRRKQEKAPVDVFDIKVYERAVDTYTAQWKGLEKTADFEDARFKTFAARAAIAARSKGFDARVTDEQTRSVETVKSIEFWTGASARTVGLFRKVFGRTFVKVLQFYEKARDKLAGLFKSKSPPAAGGGGLPGAVLKAAHKIIKAAARLLVQRTASELFSSFQKGATQWVKSLLPAEATEALEARVQQIEALRKEIDEKIKAEVEELVGQTVGPYEQIIADLETAAAVASAIATIVNVVKWGMRVVACLSPPAWGCLWVLAQPVAEYLAAKAVETCWFQRTAAPLLTGIDYVKKIPKRLANLIIDDVIKKALPQSLHHLFPEIDVNEEVKPEELECETPDRNPADAGMRSNLTGMANALGDERVAALADLTKAAGVDPAKALTLKDVACLRGSIVDTAVSADQMKEYAKQFPARPEGVPASLEICLQAGKRVSPPPPATPPVPLAGAGDASRSDARGVASKPPQGRTDAGQASKGAGKSAGTSAAVGAGGGEGRGGGDLADVFDFCPSTFVCKAAHPITFAAEDDPTLGLRAEIASLNRPHAIAANDPRPFDAPPPGGSLLRSKSRRGPLVVKPAGEGFDVFMLDVGAVEHLVGKAKSAARAGEFEAVSGAMLDQCRAAALKWERHFNIPASKSRAHRIRFS